MIFEQGLYEQIINKLFAFKLSSLEQDKFYIKETLLNKEEAAQYLSRYLANVINIALSSLPKDDSIEKQLTLSNKIITLLRDELDQKDFEENLIDAKGRILTAVFSKLTYQFSDFDKHIHEITPATRFSQSELFTGSNKRISMESELKKEILSADKIKFLVAFIKWSGIRIFEKQLREFTESGKQLEIITTSYMGATDVKAIEFLSSLKNTQIKISYNTRNERLHAKAYLFIRNSGFNTGYIGSSNISHSALTGGLEWNLKVTSQEIAHIIKKFESTFESYWEDREFELFDTEKDFPRLSLALKQQKFVDKDNGAVYFDLKPFHYQEEILEKLEAERTLHNRFRNLVVAATGTGKTVVSAFDYKRFKNNNAKSKLLFVAHRKEILTQAIASFRGILHDGNFGELWVDGEVPTNFEYVFASVQTLNSQIKSIGLAEDYYDFIIIDEVHHIAAQSYRPILKRFVPKVLLGLTATPERMDGGDILEDFCNVIAADIRLPEALNRKLLCPFQYFGITDETVDLSTLQWKNGKYLPSELTKVYTNGDSRVNLIIHNLRKYLNDIDDVRALGFCASQDHARYMAEKFLLAGIKADYLTSGNSSERDHKRSSLKNKEINYLFVVDIFNEGIDVREIDTVLFLRPTESLTIFLQQLGRGLRLADKKECLTVLDFVGNARSEYDFEGKLRALVGKTNSPIEKEIENDFPNVPLGCSIILERVAKELILRNIKNALGFNRQQLISKIRSFSSVTDEPLTLKSFSNFYRIPLQLIYKKGSWKTLLQEAGILNSFDNTNEKEIVRTIKNKWLSCSSSSYLEFILKLAINSFKVEISSLSDEEKLMAVMLYYDVWQVDGLFPTMEDAFHQIGKNEVLINEIIEVVRLLIDKIDHVEREIKLPYFQPLKIHSRYTREQVLAAFELSKFSKKSSNREGVADIPEKNTELLFITLNKSEENYSPTTLYNDYAINDYILHWQSQNASRPDTGKGKSYIEQKDTGKKFLLFVREQNGDEFGNTMGYVFLGDANYLEHEGAKPMNIKWELSEPMPAYIWNETAKMAIG